MAYFTNIWELDIFLFLNKSTKCVYANHKTSHFHAMSYSKILACPNPVSVQLVFPLCQPKHPGIVPLGILYVDVPIGDSSNILRPLSTMLRNGKLIHFIGVESYHKSSHDIPATDYSSNRREYTAICPLARVFNYFYGYKRFSDEVFL